MLRVLINMLMVIVLLQAASSSAEPEPRESADSFQLYRCEIIITYISLSKITNEFGNILLSENYENIFLASKAVVAHMDEMKRELESMDVPEQMKEPYEALLKSIESYGQSADRIRTGIGIFLGKYDQKGLDIQELINQSEYHAVMANKYLGLSIVMHRKLFETYTQGSNKCKKYIALK